MRRQRTDGPVPGARALWRDLAALLALPLGILAVAPLLAPPAAAPDGAATGAAAGALLLPPGPALDTAAWQAAWRTVALALDGDLLDTFAEQALGQPLPPGGLAGLGIHAAADTGWMRQPGLPPLTPALQLRFQAAAITQAPAARRALLTALVQDSNGPVRERARIGLSFSWLRESGADGRRRAAGLAREVLAEADEDDPSRADGLFVLGLITLLDGDPAAALDWLRPAVAADPNFFDARALLLEALAATPPTPADAGCLAQLLETMTQIQWLGVLAEDRGQFRQVAVRLGATPTARGPGHAFAVAYAAFLAGDWPQARHWLERAGQSLHGLPGGCRRELGGRIAWMAERLPATAGPR